MRYLRFFRSFSTAVFAVALLVSHARSAVAAGAFEPPLSKQEFQSLATEFAPKINLFRDVWSKSPDAAFTGGTVRDYLYWLKEFPRSK